MNLWKDELQWRFFQMSFNLKSLVAFVNGMGYLLTLQNNWTLENFYDYVIWGSLVNNIKSKTVFMQY